MAQNYPNNHKSGLVKDLPSEVDHLGFKPYVEAISSFLCSEFTASPLTLSVEGEWGSGKSSFIDQLSLEISTRIKPYYYIRFNPWRYSENEALWAAFAVEIERKIYKLTPWYKKLLFKAQQINWVKLGWDLAQIFLPPTILFLMVGHWPELFKHFKYQELGKTLLFIGSCIYALFPAKDVLNELKEKLGNGLMTLKIKDYAIDRPNYSGKIPFLDRFHDDIQALVKKLAGENRVYIFIDDLDRCSPNQAVELVQAINLLISDDLKAFFILAIDSKKIATGIINKHKDFIGLTSDQAKKLTESELLNYGYEYLDKFIQIPFKLPTPKENDIRRFFFQIVESSCDPLPPPAKPEDHRNIGWRYFVAPDGSWIGGLGKDGSTYPDSHVPLTEATLPSDAIEVPYAPSDSQDKWDFEKRRYYSPEKPKLENASYGPSIIEKAETIEFNSFARDSMLPILTMAAIFLRNNPRKIKKFFNLFKFYVYLGNAIGLFGKNRDGYYIEGSGITAPQLAKLLLINYQWPEVIEICKIFPNFLEYIMDYQILGETTLTTKLELNCPENKNKILVLIRTWVENQSLMTLLEYQADFESHFDATGKVIGINNKPIIENAWKIVDINISVFLEVSPTYERATIFKDRLANILIPEPILCDFCKEEIFKKDLGIYWDLQKNKIYTIKLAHVGKCGIRSNLSYSTGPGMEDIWDAKDEYNEFNKQDFIRSKDKERVLKAIASIINSDDSEKIQKRRSDKSFDYNIEGQGYNEGAWETKNAADFSLDEAYAVAPYDADQILSTLEEELNNNREANQPPYKLQGDIAQIAYDHWRKGDSTSIIKSKIDWLIAARQAIKEEGLPQQYSEDHLG